MTKNEVQELKALKDENRRFKRLVADLSLDNQILKDVNSKNW
jgi:putative transposase